MRILFFLFLLFGCSFSLYAQAVDSTGCTGAIGDAKFSILAPPDFQAENGNCWVLMDGNNISGSKLMRMYGINMLPDGRGVFLRGYDNRQEDRLDIDREFGAPVGVYQEDLIREHYHLVPGMKGILNDLAGQHAYGTEGNSHSAHELYFEPQPMSKTSSVGESETRPKNINLYMYIRIN